MVQCIFEFIYKFILMFDLKLFILFLKNRIYSIICLQKYYFMFKMYLFYMLFIFNINYNEYCILFVFVQNSDFVWREFYCNVEIYNYISIGVFSLVLVSIFLFF